MGANFSSEPVVEKHTERDQNDIFTAAVSSCQGWRLSQEDEHSLILDLPGEHKASFFAVFDGHGSGRVSKHASVGLWRHLTENDNYIKGNYKEALEESFLSFDREVNESYNAQLAGTTAICVLVVDNVVYCANVGDSRAVASINCECVPLSQDHKPENSLELKRIYAAGGYVFGNRVNGNLALSRAFGDFHYKSNDQLPADQQIVSPQPDIKRIELNDEVDFIVLACDGIWDVMTSEDVVKFVISRLEQDIEPGLICEQLTTRCIATDYELVIGCDNMTVLLVCHTRGRSWSEYCTDIFNKHSELLGTPRTRTFADNPDVPQQDPFLDSNSSSTIDQDISARQVIDIINEGNMDNGLVSTTQEDDTQPRTESNSNWISGVVAEEPASEEDNPSPDANNEDCADDDEEEEAPTCVVELSTPDEDTTTPDEENSTPTVESSTCVVELSSPDEDTSTPDEENPASTGDSGNPADDISTSAENTSTAADEAASSPTEEEQTTVHEQESDGTAATEADSSDRTQ